VTSGAAALSSIQSTYRPGCASGPPEDRGRPATAANRKRPLPNARHWPLPIPAGAMTLSDPGGARRWHRFLCWPIAGRVHRSCLPKSSDGLATNQLGTQRQRQLDLRWDYNPACLIYRAPAGWLCALPLSILCLTVSGVCQQSSPDSNSSSPDPKDFFWLLQMPTGLARLNPHALAHHDQFLIPRMAGRPLSQGTFEELWRVRTSQENLRNEHFNQVEYVTSAGIRRTGSPDSAPSELMESWINSSIRLQWIRIRSMLRTPDG